MATYDYVLQDHLLTTEYAWEGRYLVRCTCRWERMYRYQWEAERAGREHLSERERALEKAREKTRYLIHEEP